MLLRPRSVLLLVIVALAGRAEGNDNGLALTPPLGWRSWNLYGANVDQKVIESIMAGMVKRTRKDHTGKLVSLCDLGYCDVGLDDNWQACGDPRAAPGMHYHDADGNPLINEERFPDLKAMTDYAHSLNLTSGWYGNNCICGDHCRNASECDMQIQGDVKAMHGFGFDAWKLDGCGGEKDLVLFNKYVQSYGKPIMVENCHWGSVQPFEPDPSLPPAEGCPWNFYRSSGDVRASYASILSNLASVSKFHSKNLSYPGCWAYPDMLQVGCQHGPGGAGDPGLTQAETRTHFGAWSIVSSPLTLSHDVNNDTVMDSIWDVISNWEVLEVNQAYVGDSGAVFQSSEETIDLADAHITATEGEDAVTTPKSQYLSKKMSGERVAVLMMNSDDNTATLDLDFSSVPGVLCGIDCKYHVRDIWAHKDLGILDHSFSATVSSHDAAFVVLSPMDASAPSSSARAAVQDRASLMPSDPPSHRTASATTLSLTIDPAFLHDVAAANATHYGDPTVGCQSDEVAVQIQGIGGDFCTSKCSIFETCPTDVPSKVTATPQCALSDASSGSKYCALICDPSAGHDTCGSATCKSISGVGICTYDD